MNRRKTSFNIKSICKLQVHSYIGIMNLKAKFNEKFRHIKDLDKMQIFYNQKMKFCPSPKKEKPKKKGLFKK